MYTLRSAKLSRKSCNSPYSSGYHCGMLSAPFLHLMPYQGRAQRLGEADLLILDHLGISAKASKNPLLQSMSAYQSFLVNVLRYLSCNMLLAGLSLSLYGRLVKDGSELSLSCHSSPPKPGLARSCFTCNNSDKFFQSNSQGPIFNPAGFPIRCRRDWNPTSWTLNSDLIRS